MHNRLFIADGRVAVTGGRNVAAEYFDLKFTSNFRDRDVLLIDGEVSDAQASFEEFWAHPLAQPIEGLIGKPLPYDKERVWAAMREYSCDPEHFLPILRQRIAAVPRSLLPLDLYALALADLRSDQVILCIPMLSSLRLRVLF